MVEDEEDYEETPQEILLIQAGRNMRKMREEDIKNGVIPPPLPNYVKPWSEVKKDLPDTDSLLPGILRPWSGAADIAPASFTLTNIPLPIVHKGFEFNVAATLMKEEWLTFDKLIRERQKEFAEFQMALAEEKLTGQCRGCSAPVECICPYCGLMSVKQKNWMREELARRDRLEKEKCLTPTKIQKLLRFLGLSKWRIFARLAGIPLPDGSTQDDYEDD